MPPLTVRILDNPPPSPWTLSAPDDPVLLWRARHDSAIWAAVGVAAEFDSLDEAIAALPEQDGLPFAPRCSGTIAFDPQSPMEGIWYGFGSERYWIPRGLVRWSGNVAEAIEIRSQASRPLHLNSINEERSQTPQVASERTNLLQDTWQTAIEFLQFKMQQGEIEKAVLSRRVTIDFDDALLLPQVLMRVAAGDPGGYFFALTSEAGSCFCGNSPERLLAVKQRRVMIDSLAGSRPLSTNALEASRQRRSLRNSTKDSIEQQFVTEYVREKLLGVCEEVAVTEPVVREANRVMHLFTEIHGMLKAERSLGNILHTLHPTPAVCGVPAEASSELIRKVEPDLRGLYAGVVGMASRDFCEFAVAIRSGLIESNRATLFAGAGIVAESEANAEYEECEWKLKAMRDALSGANEDSE